MGFFDTDSEELKSKIVEWNKAYRSGTPFVSDAQYDDALEELSTLIPEVEYIFFIKTLNEGSVESGTKIKSDYILGSLEKYKYEEPEKFYKWLAKENMEYLYCSEKIDGCSFSATYNNGKLISCTSRGDGETGVDWTEKAKFIIPTKIIFNNPFIIRGEFTLHNEDIEELGYKNTRNGTVGIMNSKTIDQNELSYVHAYVYEVISDDLPVYKQFEMLSKMSFDVPKIAQFYPESDVHENIKEFYLNCKASSKYDIDGIVCCSKDYHRENVYIPEGKIAFKINDIPVEATITGITWELSKNRLMKPVCQITPTVISGSTITNVTGYNAQYISDNGINTGAVVTIVKSGQIIPKIIDVLKPATEVSMPLFCPECSNGLVWKGVELYCSNEKCGETKRIEHFIKAIGIERVSLQTLINWNIKTFDDLIEWTPDSKYKTQTDFWTELDNKVFKNSPESILRAMPMDGMGTTLFDNLLAHLGDLDSMKELFLNDSKVSLPSGIGVKTIANAKPSFKTNWTILENIVSNPRYKKPEPKQSKVDIEYDNKLNGASFLFTGTLSIKRSQAESLVTENGGINASSVSKNLSYLVCGSDSWEKSSKYNKALKLGITIITEQEFMDMVK